jgi:hypothetical protein
MMVMSREFLVAYDYETGGAWAFILADSEEQLRMSFPELRIVTHRPPWLNEEEEHLIRERMTIEVTDINHPFLAALIRSRSQDR